MKNKQAYYAFATALSNYYRVPVDSILRGEEFSISIPEATLIGENIQQNSSFLQQINMVQVSTLKGKKLLGAQEKGITGRKHLGRYLTELGNDQYGYELFETDSGVIIPWAMFDAFAIHKDKLGQLYNEYVNTQIALDMLQIGWHGISVAENTQKEDLSDVNKGWLQLLKEQKPENFLTESDTGKGKVTIFGANATYANLDELAYDLKQGLDLRHQSRNDLIFLVGADLVSKETKIIQKQHGLTPTEKAALGSHNLLGSFGGMNAITPPNFPTMGAVVTTLKNLSIYTEQDSVRLRYENNQDRKGLINSYYRQEGYVVEDLGLMVAVDPTKVELEPHNPEVTQ